MITRRLLLPTLAALALLVIPALGQEAPRSPTPKFSGLSGRQVDVAHGLDHPWGLAFLPDGRMLVTERAGRLRIVGPDGELSEPLAGVPRVLAGGQGGLLDVALSPTFAQDRLVYLSFSEPGEGGASTAVARGRLGERGLEETRTIWRQQPKVGSSIHWGSRLVFRPDGTLFVTLGDRGSRDHVQDLSATIGKIVRINPDGTIPRDNPFVGRDGVRPEIWSYGHRNVQAAALDARGQLWTVEHGARGGDELNNPQPGRNYGWPVVSYGRDYPGPWHNEVPGHTGFEAPAVLWIPAIAVSGMTFYTGDKLPKWKGDVFVGSLRTGEIPGTGHLERILFNEKMQELRRESLLTELRQRIRDVRQGPDGLLYVLTDEKDGAVLRIEPAP